MVLPRLISAISNPIFILLGLPYVLVVNSTGNETDALLWTFYIWIFLGIFGVFVLIGVNRKFFSDIDVSIRNQRFLLYFFGALLCLLSMVGMLVFQAPVILIAAGISIMAGIVLGSIVNLFIKASVHVATLTAFVTGLVIVYGGMYYFLFLSVPVVCWARIRIKRHSIAETIVGSILGFLVSFIMYHWAKIFFSL